uniref:Putative ovule protein n=1 Tax=Solanum chacoense TaxID=4108 RepID=A0A0V0GQC2_SOLCH
MNYFLWVRGTHCLHLIRLNKKRQPQVAKVVVNLTLSAGEKKVMVLVDENQTFFCFLFLWVKTSIC